MYQSKRKRNIPSTRHNGAKTSLSTIKISKMSNLNLS